MMILYVVLGVLALLGLVCCYALCAASAGPPECRLCVHRDNFSECFKAMDKGECDERK